MSLSCCPGLADNLIWKKMGFSCIGLVIQCNFAIDLNLTKLGERLGNRNGPKASNNQTLELCQHPKMIVTGLQKHLPDSYR